MKGKFHIVIERKRDEYEARCRELPDVVARGRDKNGVLEEIRALITKRLGGDSDAGSAPMPLPVSPSPRGPIIVEVLRGNPGV